MLESFDAHKQVAWNHGHEARAKCALRPDGKQLAYVPPHTNLISPDGARGDVLLQPLPEGAPITLRSANESMVHGLVYSPDGTLLLVGHDDHEFELIDVETLAPIARFLKDMSGGFQAAFSPAGDVIAIAGTSCGYSTLFDVAPPAFERYEASAAALGWGALGFVAASRELIALTPDMSNESMNREDVEVVVLTRHVDPAQRKEVCRRSVKGVLSAMALSPKGDMLAFSHRDPDKDEKGKGKGSPCEHGTVLSLPSGEVLFTFGPLGSEIKETYFYFLHGSRYLYAVGQFGGKVFDVHAAAPAGGSDRPLALERAGSSAHLSKNVSPHHMFKEGRTHSGAAVNAKGTLLAYGTCRGNQVVVRELPSEKEVARIDEDEGLPLGIFFDEKQDRLLWRSYQGKKGTVTVSASLEDWSKKPVCPNPHGMDQYHVSPHNGGLLLSTPTVRWVDEKGMSPRGAR